MAFPLMAAVATTLVGLSLAADLVRAGDVVSATRDVPAVAPGAPIRFQKEKPDRTKRPTLVFLRENLDFLRAQIDGIYWNEEARGDTEPIDPRWLGYLEMESDLTAADARLAGEDAALAQRRLLESVSELVAVDERLGELSDLLAAHEGRLAQLRSDYVADHVTSLVVLAQGVPRFPLDGLRLRREDGRETVLPLDAGLRTVLENGGVVELDHEFIEPRAQWLELVLPASSGHDGASVWFEVRPERDHLHFVQLDLTSFDLSAAPDAWRAESWSRPSALGSGDWTW